MLGKINKFARGLLAPQVDPLVHFQNACTDVLKILRDGTVEEIPKLARSLNLIVDALQKERNNQDCRYLNYMTEYQILQKIADLITGNLKSEHVEPLLHFFLRFLAPEMIDLLHQVAIHSALATVLSKLDFLDRKCPIQTQEFVSNLWQKMEEDPIQFELLAIRREDGRSFPILDYFCTMAFSTSENGKYCRTVAHRLMLRRTELGRVYFHYMKSKIFPPMTDLLTSIAGYAQTIAFRGVMTSFVDWCDKIIACAPEFDIAKVFDVVETKLSVYKRLLAMSFFIANFQCETVRKAAIAFCLRDTTMDEIVQSCQSEHDDIVRAALALISQLLNVTEIAAEVLPPKCERSAHILSLVPAEWLMESEGAAAPEAYSRSASARRKIYGGKRAEGTNPRIYEALLSVFSRFSALSLNTCLTLTRVLSSFHTVAPDLINDELADTFSTVVAEYEGIIPAAKINTSAPVTPETRARILAEFAKEVHGTYVSSNA